MYAFRCYKKIKYAYARGPPSLFIPLGALAAQTMQCNAFLVYLAPLQNLIGQERLIKHSPVKVGYFVTIFANCMMVFFHFTLETGLAFRALDPGNKSMLFKCGKGSIYRVERYGRKFWLQPTVKFFDSGVVLGIEEFLKNLKALVGDLQPLFPADFLKNTKALFS